MMKTGDGGTGGGGEGATTNIRVKMRIFVKPKGYQKVFCVF